MWAKVFAFNGSYRQWVGRIAQKAFACAFVTAPL